MAADCTGGYFADRKIADQPGHVYNCCAVWTEIESKFVNG